MIQLNMAQIQMILLIHGCIPVDENGEMESFEIDGHTY
ncbi:fructose-bisphosphatase class III, partial [Staphylococcus aureus]|nr:fructose-bisphosphatase class III [Staphylococcus aureus]